MSIRMLPDRASAGFWILLTGLKSLFFLSMAAAAVAVAFQIAGQFIIGKIVDGTLENITSMQIFRYALIFISCAIGGGLFLFVKGRSTAKTSEGIAKNIRNSLYDRMQKLNFLYHDKIKTGELIQRSTNDVDTIRLLFQEHLSEISRILFLFIFNFCAIMLIDWKLALISSIIAPVIILSSIYFFTRIHKSFEAYQDQAGVLSSVLQENLSGMRIVRAFARQDFENQKFEVENAEKFKRGKRFLLNHTIYWPVSHILCMLQLITGFAVGGIMVMDGVFSIGTYIFYIQILLALIWPLQELGRVIAQLSTAVVSYKRVKEILNESEEDLESGKSEGTITGKISIKDLDFSYDQTKNVLSGITLNVEAGQKIALLGEAGSGKTTLVNLLPRFYDFYKGDFLLDGQPLQKYSRHFLRKNIGIVEQEPFLFSTTIRENICYGVNREVEMSEVEEAAKAAAIHESITTFPKGYDTIVGEKGVTLSGGQKQRIAIARTILKDPRILIMDDSTSAVDAETEESIMECLNHLMLGRTSFIIAHRIQSLMNADIILVFKDGKIIQRGNHESLIKEKGFYQRVFSLQTQIEEELDKEINYA